MKMTQIKGKIQIPIYNLDGKKWMYDVPFEIIITDDEQIDSTESSRVIVEDLNYDYKEDEFKTKHKSFFDQKRELRNRLEEVIKDFPDFGLSEVYEEKYHRIWESLEKWIKIQKSSKDPLLEIEKIEKKMVELEE